MPNLLAASHSHGGTAESLRGTTYPLQRYLSNLAGEVVFHNSLTRKLRDSRRLTVTLFLSFVIFLKKIYILFSDMASTLPPGTDLGNRGPEVRRIAAIFAVLGTSTAIARLISRKLQKSNLHASDYTIMLGLLVAWGQAALVFIGILILLFDQLKPAKTCFLLAVSYGLGKHSEVQALTTLVKGQKVRAQNVDED